MLDPTQSEKTRVYLSDEVMLEMIHSEKVDEYLPVMVVVASMVAIGTLGNALSLVYHGWRLPRTPTNYNINALAVVDLAMCLTTSILLVQLYYNVTFTSSAGCKTIYFMTYWLTTLSGSVLAFVGFDRYRRICRPFQWQLTVRRSKVALFILVLFTLLLTSKTVITTDVIKMNITSVNRGKTLFTHGSYCTHSDMLENAAVLWALHVIDLLVYCTLIFIVFMCYSCIAWRLYKSRKCMNDKAKGMRVIFSQPNRVTMGITVADDQDVAETSGSVSKWSSIASFTDFSVNRKQCTSLMTTAQRSGGGTMSRRETKVTLMTAALTLASILSVAPYFVVKLSLKPSFSRPEEELSVWIQLAMFSYPINNVINPYIIAIFHPKFRAFIKHTICAKCRS